MSWNGRYQGHFLISRGVLDSVLDDSKPHDDDTCDCCGGEIDGDPGEAYVENAGITTEEIVFLCEDCLSKCQWVTKPEPWMGVMTKDFVGTLEINHDFLEIIRGNAGKILSLKLISKNQSGTVLEWVCDSDHQPKCITDLTNMSDADLAGDYEVTSIGIIGYRTDIP